ncbi:MAG TPA: hypothetical protein VF731_02350, partial [Solirubrobacterales bacterium]
GDRLRDAYTQWAELNDQIASAAQEAADKLKQARDALRQRVDEAVSQMGQLFAGPIIAPSDTQIKQQLGFLPPTMKTLTGDLEGQNKYYRAWMKDIRKLIKAGAPKQLIQELMALGPDYAAYVHRLATASKKQLQKYFKAYQERVKLGLQVASVKMTARNVDLVARSVQFKQIGHPRKMQAGGVVTQPTYALLGEAGAEAVIPLRKLLRARAETDRRVALRANPVRVPQTIMVERGVSGGGEVILQLDSEVLARATLPKTQRKARRQIARVRGRRGGEILALG